MAEDRAKRFFQTSAHGPFEAAQQDRANRFGKVRGDMTERTVEHPAIAVTPLPDDRHHGPGDPFAMLPRQRGARQHMVGGIDMHVIQFRMH